MLNSAPYVKQPSSLQFSIWQQPKNTAAHLLAGRVSREPMEQAAQGEKPLFVIRLVPTLSNFRHVDQA